MFVVPVSASDLFALHQPLLERAIEAIASREHWTPYPENLRPYGEEALAAGPAENADIWLAMDDGAAVLMRHAEAPGGGDPPGFRLDDCTTQRNLDEVGRDQARRIGQAFRERGIRVGRVLSSRWCRARDTARLAFGEPVQEAEVFDSFFGTPQRREARTADAPELEP